MAFLAATGHPLSEVLYGQQPRLPYRGWSLVQYRFYMEKSERLMGMVIGRVASLLPGAISAALDKKAQRAYAKVVSGLMNPSEEHDG